MGASGDLRYGWILVDLLRFQPPGEGRDRLVAELVGLTEVPVPDDAVAWVHFTELLVAWDVPAPADYVTAKRAVLAAHDPSWGALVDGNPSIDWRLVTATGVGADRTEALDDPAIVPAADGDWLPDDDRVVGVVVDGRARAYPRRILEVHQVVNDTLGGRRLAVTHSPSGDATAVYRADGVEGSAAMTLRPSGLAHDGNTLLQDEASGSLLGQLPRRGPDRSAGRARRRSRADSHGHHDVGTLAGRAPRHVGARRRRRDRAGVRRRPTRARSRGSRRRAPEVAGRRAARRERDGRGCRRRRRAGGGVRPRRVLVRRRRRSGGDRGLRGPGGRRRLDRDRRAHRPTGRDRRGLVVGVEPGPPRHGALGAVTCVGGRVVAASGMH
ncbi:MAG: DUF3179 domain-containing (seleno)protein [Acidimicrobiia bacterium]|nr:DUF3179 domain-containing (seleno)protein [Acidimicrobiia bacterium]